MRHSVQKRRIVTAAILLLLLAAVCCLLPDRLPFDRLNTLHGLVDPSTGAAVTSLPCGAAGADLRVVCAPLLGEPDCTLYLADTPLAAIDFHQETIVHLDAQTLADPGTMVFRLRYRLFPGVVLTSNEALIEVD